MHVSYVDYLKVLRKYKIEHRFVKQKSNGLAGYKPNREIYVKSKNGQETKR